MRAEVTLDSHQGRFLRNSGGGLEELLHEELLKEYDEIILKLRTKSKWNL